MAAHTGVVRRRGANFGQDTRATIMERDIVLYSKGSEFKNKIEGKEVYLMRQWNIIARKEQYMLGGKELWKFDPSEHARRIKAVNRGIAYWQENAEKAQLRTHKVLLTPPNQL